jgi:hypothetical protein
VVDEPPESLKGSSVCNASPHVLGCVYAVEERKCTESSPNNQELHVHEIERKVRDD